MSISNIATLPPAPAWDGACDSIVGDFLKCFKKESNMIFFITHTLFNEIRRHCTACFLLSSFLLLSLVSIPNTNL